jgi:hypothetical protein
MLSPMMPLQLPRNQVSILLLGPGQAQPKDLLKRTQILNELKQRGYTQTNMGEDFAEAGSGATWPLMLKTLVRDLDLILVLNSGVAPLVELTILWPDIRAREVTRVWCKLEHYTARSTTPKAIIDSFDCRFYNQNEFDTCDLTAEFVQAAERVCLNKAQRLGLLSDIGLTP